MAPCAPWGAVPSLPPGPAPSGAPLAPHQAPRLTMGDVISTLRFMLMLYVALCEGGSVVEALAAARGDRVRPAQVGGAGWLRGGGCPRGAADGGMAEGEGGEMRPITTLVVIARDEVDR